MPYATLDELTEHLEPDPTPANGARLLERASRDVDRVLKCAVYDVDDAGMPTAQPIIDALREATLEQVAWRLAQGDDDGVSLPYSSVSIGSVTLQRAAGGVQGGGTVGPLGEQATEILEAAGLLGAAPWQV